METYRVPYAETPRHIVDAMLDLADLRSGEVLYDLGCGDGRIAFAADRRGAVACAFDLTSTQLAAMELATSRVYFTLGDIFLVDLSVADVVAFYLDARSADLLIPQFAAMRPNSRIVSLDFRIGRIPPTMTATMRDDSQRCRLIHLYRNPIDWGA